MVLMDYSVGHKKIRTHNFQQAHGSWHQLTRTEFPIMTETLVNPVSLHVYKTDIILMLQIVEVC